jgi:predicted Zn finger-like uncharacterized protein
MDVRCERCRTHYVFDDDQVTEAGLAVQCSKCGHLFRVKRKALVVTVPVSPNEFGGAAPIMADDAARAPHTPHPSPPEKPREWRVRQVNGNTFTFKELTTLQKWIVERKVGRGDEISLSGDQWKRLGAISELAAFFQVVEEAERARAKAPMITPPAFLSPGQDQSQPPTPIPEAAHAAPETLSSESRPSAETVTRESPLSDASRVAPADDPAWTNQKPTPPEADLENEETRPISRRRSRGPRLLLFVLALAAVALFFLQIRGCPGRGAGDRLNVEPASPSADAGVKPHQGVPTLPEPNNPVASLPRPTTSSPSPTEKLDAPTEPALPPGETPEPVVEPAPTEPDSPVVDVKPEPTDDSTDTAPVPAADSKKKPAEKKAAEKKAPDKKPKDPEARTVDSLLEQAGKLRDRGQSQKALDPLAEAIELEPDNSEALAARGWCYLDLSRYALAESSFQRALEKNPSFSEALMGLAETYRFQGRKADAVKYYEQYLAAHPKGEDAVAAQNAISKLKE